MVEKKILVDDLRINYSGIFDVKELYRLLDDLIIERGYVKHEKRNDEIIRPSGRQIYLELRPTKEFEMDHYGIAKIRVKMTDVKEVTVKKDNKDVKLNQGNVLVILDGWTTTSYEFAWETKPLFVFIRMVFDKFIYKISFGKYEGEIINDIKYMRDRIKANLNLYRY